MFVPRQFVLPFLLALALPVVCRAATTTATSSGAWTDAIWDNGTPGAGDDVIIAGGVTVSVPSTPPTLQSLTLQANATLSFDQGVAADLNTTGDLTVAGGATIVCTYSSLTANGGQGAGRILTVGGNAVIDGTIDADGQGFPQRQGPGYAGATGNHGGMGRGGPSSLYGIATAPTALGSGSYNGDGGGAIKLEVSGTLALTGEITADGTRNNHGPSGGSVWLVAVALMGDGIVSADAKQTGNTYGGGGGRVAIEYTSSTFTGSVSAAGGDGSSTSGQPGTLWEPDRYAALHGAPGAPAAVSIDTGFQYLFPDTTPYYWDLTVTARIELHDGDLSIDDLVMTGGELRFDENRVGTDAFAMSALSIAGSISLTDSDLYLPADSFALTGNLGVDANSTLYALGDTTAINAASGGTAADPHGAGVSISCANATVAGNINANGRGFPPREGPGGSGGSASHGGRGSHHGGKVAYGSWTQPTALGSGSYNGIGGGAIKLAVAGALTVDGTISANSNTGDHGAGGGSVWLSADSFAGSGAITADSLGGSLAGGGGRVAITYNTKTYNGSVSVAGSIGTGRSAWWYGQPGTLWEPKRFEGQEGTAAIPANITIDTSYQYIFPDATPHYWNLNIDGVWFQVHDGVLALGGLIVTDGEFRYDDSAYGNDYDDTMVSFDLLPTADIDVLRGRVRLNDGCIESYGNVWAVGSASTTPYPTPAELDFAGTHTLSGDLSLDADSVMYARGDTAAVNEASGGTAGEPHGAGVSIACVNATIDGTLDAYRRGFPQGQGPGYDGVAGAHGGATARAPGQPYGSLAEPTALGAGGYNDIGGGAIKLAASGTLALAGTINADGGPSNHGPAGGSVWLVAGNLAVSGSISASADTVSQLYGGAGGRVAVDYVSGSLPATVTVAGGPGSSSSGDPGTYLSVNSPCYGALHGICNGISMDSDFAADSHSTGVRIQRTISEWTQTLVEWTDTSTDLSSVALNNSADYELAGLLPSTKYNVYENAALTSAPTTGASGELTLSGIALEPTTTVRVEEAPPENQPPAANCKDATVCANRPDVDASAIDNGSFDPDGDPITLTLTPPPPYLPGTHTVTLTVTDDGGLFNTCTAQVTATITRTWNGVGDWHANPENWFPCPPADGEPATIASGTVTLSANTPLLTSLEVQAGAALTFTQGAAADITVSGDFTVAAGATITCPYSSLTANGGEGAGRVITVGGDATVAGTINADGRGFPSREGPGGSGGSGSHGGRGSHHGGKVAYGSATQPTALGSGSYNGIGGGAIRLAVAGALTVDGTISANSNTGNHGAGGGSVWLSADSFAGSGAITADSLGGSLAGGGGRVAITYNTKTYTGSVSVAGSIGTGRSAWWYGQPGTLWEPKRFEGQEGTAASPANITIDASYQYIFPDATPYYWNLTIDGAWFEVHDGVLSLGDLTVTDGEFRCDDSAYGNDYDETMVLFDLLPTADIDVLRGRVRLNDGFNDSYGNVWSVGSAVTTPYPTLSELDFCGTHTLSGDLDLNAESILYARGDLGAINPDSGGTATTPHGAGVTITSANATIDGAIDATGRGFTVSNKGPGGGTTGSYGGQSSRGPAPYGNLAEPTALGSGGYNAIGGGAVKLDVAGALSLNGSIKADANNGNHGASGGSVWLLAGALSGTGSISADAFGTAYAGGAGRVAIEAVTNSFTGPVTVNGYTTGSWVGDPGTWLSSVSQCYGDVHGYCNGITMDSTFATDSHSAGVRIQRAIVSWTSDRLAWTESSTDLTGTDLPNTAGYSISGLLPSTEYDVFRNAVLVGNYTTGPAGELAITGIAMSDINMVVELANQPPTAVCSDVTVALEADGDVTVTGAQVDGGSSDPDGDALILTVAPDTFTCAELGANPVVLTVADGNGGEDTCSATVTVTNDGACDALQTFVYNGLCNADPAPAKLSDLSGLIDTLIDAFLQTTVVCDVDQCRSEILTALGLQ